MQEKYKTVAAISKSEEVARLRERAKFNEASALANARCKERLAIAERLIKRGVPIEEIVEDTGLTHKEVGGLRG
ncbi:MAG: hypothetical protein FWH07_02560 [Oscillospiraceae bacterium]|nr:hypothetical protein [Oscillospiraceae bacterium]